MSDIQNFITTNAGKENGTAKSESESGLNGRQEVAFDNNTDLSDVIHFNDKGRVYHIKLESSAGVYDHVLLVDARGPSGAFSGSGHLKFTDVSGDTYKLGIYSSTRSLHTLRYNSKNPAIVKIEWSS